MKYFPIFPHVSFVAFIQNAANRLLVTNFGCRFGDAWNSRHVSTKFQCSCLLIVVQGWSIGAAAIDREIAVDSRL